MGILGLFNLSLTTTTGTLDTRLALHDLNGIDRVTRKAPIWEAVRSFPGPVQTTSYG